MSPVISPCVLRPAMTSIRVVLPAPAPTQHQINTNPRQRLCNTPGPLCLGPSIVFQPGLLAAMQQSSFCTMHHDGTALRTAKSDSSLQREQGQSASSFEKIQSRTCRGEKCGQGRQHATRAMVRAVKEGKQHGRAWVRVGQGGD